MEKKEISVSENNVSEIFSIEKECFELLLPASTFNEAIKNKDYFKCVEIDKKIVAYLLGTFNDYEGEIIEIAVLPNYRNNGYAQLLINNFVKFLSGKEFLYLEVRENNIKAIELYKKIGFEQYNIRKHYYRDGVNAILFRKKLIS